MCARLVCVCAWLSRTTTSSHSRAVVCVCFLSRTRLSIIIIVFICFVLCLWWLAAVDVRHSILRCTIGVYTNAHITHLCSVCVCLCVIARCMRLSLPRRDDRVMGANVRARTHALDGRWWREDHARTSGVRVPVFDGNTTPAGRSHTGDLRRYIIAVRVCAGFGTTRAVDKWGRAREVTVLFRNGFNFPGSFFYHKTLFWK